MSELVVRRLLIDLEKDFSKSWCNNDPFLSAFFNALSMSFPVGEQFFIDAVRMAYKDIGEEAQKEFKEEAQGFIGQEATHRRIHQLFNSQLTKQGLVNEWEQKSLARQAQFKELGLQSYHLVALTAAYEHLTATFSDWILKNPQIFDNTEPRLKTMWMWHGSEETEHKSVAFNLYQKLKGDYELRKRWYIRCNVLFFTNLSSQVVRNLKDSGQLWKFKTFFSAAKHLLGTKGFITQNIKFWFIYLRKDFHPDQQNSSLSVEWLKNNSSQFKVVGEN